MAAIEQPMAPPGTPAPPPGGLRGRTARGTMVNAAFMVGLSGVGLVQGVVVARLLPTDVYGLWGLLMAAFMTLLMLGSVGVDDKYVQQDDADQQRAFEIAFTLQLIIGAVFVVVVLAGMPLFAHVYGHPELVLPGIALAAALPALAFQMPLWTHYRRMDFLRQRLLQSIDPLTTFVVTVALAIAGLGLWSLVIGALAGSWVAAAAMVASSPYRLRWRFDREALGSYRSFSWPLFAAALCTAALVQGPVIVGAQLVGITAVAGIALATVIAQFAGRVEGLLTETMYPGICRVKDRPDLLWEAFWKSNRLAQLWAAPLGVAMALFAGDFVHHVIGEKWRFAVPLIAAYGLIAAVDQIGFNWTAFFRAIGETRPMAVASAIHLAVVSAVAVPLLAAEGLTAFGAGLGAATVVAVAVRLRFLRRIFPGARFAGHVVRGFAPSVPAALAVLAAREGIAGGRTLPRVAAEAVLFVAVAAAVTWAFERRLLRESLAYLTGRPAAA